MDEKLLIWCGAFLEGEGCFSISKSLNPIRHSVVVSATQKHTEPLDMLKSSLGGSIYPLQKGKYHIWTVTSKKAYGVCKDLLPYLMVKREQAGVLIEFYEKCILWREGRSKGPGNRLTETELALRDFYYMRVRDMKRQPPKENS